MKKVLLVFALTLLLVTFSGCHLGKFAHKVTGSGVRKTEKREMPAFKAIETEGSFDVEAVCQSPQSYEMEADDNILPLIKSEVRNGVLHLKAEQGYDSQRGVIVRINVPNLEKVDATGAGKYHIKSLKNDTFEVRTTGASTITVTGQTNSLEIHTTGAGTIDTHNLTAQKANVRSTGAAQVDVYASEELDATATGAAQITYRGDPKTVNKHTTGAASVNKSEGSMN